MNHWARPSTLWVHKIRTSGNHLNLVLGIKQCKQCFCILYLLDHSRRVRSLARTAHTASSVAQCRAETCEAQSCQWRTLSARSCDLPWSTREAFWSGFAWWQCTWCHPRSPRDGRWHHTWCGSSDSGRSKVYKRMIAHRIKYQILTSCSALSPNVLIDLTSRWTIKEVFPCCFLEHVLYKLRKRYVLDHVFITRNKPEGWQLNWHQELHTHSSYS